MTDPHHQAARLAAQQAFMESLARLQETLQWEATDLAAELTSPEPRDAESPDEATCPSDPEATQTPPSCTIHPLAQNPTRSAANCPAPPPPVADSVPDRTLGSPLPEPPLDPLAQSLREMEAAIADLERVNPPPPLSSPPPPSSSLFPAPLPPTPPPPPVPRRSPAPREDPSDD